MDFLFLLLASPYLLMFGMIYSIQMRALAGKMEYKDLLKLRGYSSELH